MESKDTLSFSEISHKKGTIVIITALVLLLSLVISLVQPLKYSASTSLLVIQKGDLNLDIYTASRAAEKMAENLSQVVYTSSFFYKVMDAGFDISESMFSTEENKRRKEWVRAIDTRVRTNTGILEIVVYHQNKYTAAELANAIAYVLTLQGHEYVGTENMEIKIVDNVLVSKYPVRPNVLLNGIIGLLAGFIISITFVLLFSERNNKKKQKTVGKIMEKEKTEQAFEQKPKAKIKEYEDFPEEEFEVMPKE